MQTYKEKIAQARLVAQASPEERKGRPTYGLLLKRFTIYVSYFLAGIGVKANYVTITFTIFGFIAGLCYFPRNIYVNIAGIILIQMMYFFDIVDGEVARLRNERSVFGVYLDYVAHQVASPVFAIGFGMHVYFLDTSNYFILFLALLLYSSHQWCRGLTSGARAALFTAGYKGGEPEGYKKIVDWKKSGDTGSKKESKLKVLNLIARNVLEIPFISLIGGCIVASYYLGTRFLYVCFIIYTCLLVLAFIGLLLRDSIKISKIKIT